ncbi:MAG: glycosyltransferase [Bacteriovoracaceae bacterium]
MKKILFVYNTKTTFTKQDLEILKSKYEVEELFISSFFDALKRVSKLNLSEYQLAYLWFGSLNFFPIAFAAYFFGLPYVIVAGGYDVANVPEIKYGGGTHGPFSKFLRKFMFHGASKILSISVSNQHDLLGPMPEFKDKSELIFLGFNDPQKPLLPFNKKKNKMISIGAINSVTYERKGLRFFAQLSKLMPDWDFLMIGRYDEMTKSRLESLGGKNLRFSGFLSTEDFYEEISVSKFNLQLSYHEGFGASVVDGALLGVYPIVFNIYSLPEVVGEDGSIVEFKNVEAVKAEVLKINQQGYDPEALKKSYLKRFPYEARKEQILKILDTIHKY